jgi:hypothetical protein
MASQVCRACDGPSVCVGHECPRSTADRTANHAAVINDSETVNAAIAVCAEPYGCADACSDTSSIYYHAAADAVCVTISGGDTDGYPDRAACAVANSRLAFIRNSSGRASRQSAFA